MVPSMRSEMTTKEIEDLLTSQTLGHLGCSERGTPHVYPLAFVYHDNVIYGQTMEGGKVEILRNNPSVCFQVQEVAKGGWRSAEVWGSFEELDFSDLHDKDAIHIVGLLNKKLQSIQHDYGISVDFTLGSVNEPKIIDGRKATLFRIVITEKAGARYISDGALQAHSMQTAKQAMKQ